MTPKQRYEDAHREWFASEYPTAIKDGFYCKAKVPALNTANGVTKFIVDFLTWSGHHANRISVEGRWRGNMRIKSATKKGTADINAVINGRACHFEVKIGKDSASEDQLKEQKKVRAAGGIYEFTPTVDLFFQIYDQITKAHQ